MFDTARPNSNSALLELILMICLELLRFVICSSVILTGVAVLTQLFIQRRCVMPLEYHADYPKSNIFDFITVELKFSY